MRGKLNRISRSLVATMVCLFLSAAHLAASGTTQLMFDGLEACIVQFKSPENIPSSFLFIEPLKRTCSSCTSEVGKIEKVETGATAIVEISSSGPYAHICTPDISFASNPEDADLAISKYLKHFLATGVIARTEKFGFIVCSPKNQGAVILELPSVKPKTLFFLARARNMEGLDKEC